MSRPGPPTLLLAAGGTGGHVEPALVLADALRGERPDLAVVFLGTPAGLEGALVPARGYPLELVPAVPLPRRPGRRLLALPARLAGAVRSTGRVLDRLGPVGLVGFGGYVSLPGYLAARRRGLPFVVHEANARPGLANRIGARLTPAVAVSVPGVRLPHARLIGIPLRPELRGLDRAAARPAARRELGLPAADRPTLLVTGGSQGARRLNLAATAAAGDLLGAGYHVVHVTGRAQAGPARAALEDALGPAGAAAATGVGGPYRLVDFLDRMALGYAAADLALCRAGALTCAELAAVGLPAVYVPLPIGNGEQRRNAAPTIAAGGGLAVPDAELTGARLSAACRPLLADPARLTAMGRAARSVARPDATAELARLVLETCGMIGP